MRLTKSPTDTKRPFTTPLKHKRYPKAMTIGIAAHAVHDRKPYLVLCSDWQVGDDYSTSESVSKFDDSFSDGLTALFAGTVEDVTALMDLYKKRLNWRRLALRD